MSEYHIHDRFNLLHVIDSCVTAHGALLAKERVGLGIDIPPEIPRLISGDCNLLKAKLTRLLDNSIPYFCNSRASLGVSLGRYHGFALDLRFTLSRNNRLLHTSDKDDASLGARHTVTFHLVRDRSSLIADDQPKHWLGLGQVA